MKTEMKGKMQNIGQIGNFYGNLVVKEKNEKYYWSIKDWNGHKWEEIPKSLYDELLKFNKTSKHEK